MILILGVSELNMSRRESVCWTNISVIVKELTILPQIMARVFIYMQQFFIPVTKKTDDYIYETSVY